MCIQNVIKHNHLHVVQNVYILSSYADTSTDIMHTGCLTVFNFAFFSLCSCSLVVSTSAIDCLERLVSEMTYYVSSEMLSPTYSFSEMGYYVSSKT